MAIDSVAAFVAELRQSQLLEAAQLEELNREVRSFNAALPLAKHLLKKNWLTPFQVNTLMLGQGASLAMGQYRLLERVGEGGMGQVYKARHQAMGRIVALKVIKKDKLTNEAAVRRFRREIQAAAQLTHPNVVLAFDADQAGNTHFIAMEFVDGIDLSKLVKEQGAQPVALACDIIRQAALGLQHAYERGLVHRDIKPGNLLVTRSEAANGEVQKSSGNSGVLRRRGKLQVKILDMGLARIAIEADEASSQLSHDGSVVGTPDFMAPEQAKNSHLVDHRADVYSLGCTFYYLLAGQVPYPGGTNIEKLLKHQMDSPRPIEQLRADVPEGVRAVLRRMMAKRADDRPQTAGEVATMLQSYCDPSVVRATPPSGALPVARVVGPARHGSGALPVAQVFAATSTRARSQTRQDPHSVFRNLLSGTWERRPRTRRGWVAAGLVLLFLLGTFLILRGKGTSAGPDKGAQPTSPFAVGNPTQPAATTPALPPPTGKQPPPTDKLPVAAIPLRHLPENTQVAVAFKIQDIKLSRVYTNQQFLFNQDLRPYRSMLELPLGIDLEVEVERVVLAFSDTDENTWIVYGAFERRRFLEAMQNRQGKQRRLPQIKGVEYYETPDQGRNNYVALIGGSVIIQTSNQKTLVNILERNAGLRSAEFKDPELARLIADWSNLPSIAVLVGGTGPLQGGQTYSSAGLRHLIFGIQLGDSAQVRLVLGTQSAEEAERRRDSMPAFLSAFTASDNGYSQLLKRFLEATPVVEKDNIVLQQTYTAQEVGSYFRKKPLNE